MRFAADIVLFLQGPSHNRDNIFTFTLTLGNEKYSGTGSSIKEAKKAAASNALAVTKYLMPPIKTWEKVSTPTVELNSFAYKLGLKVTYLSDDQLNEADFNSLQEKTSLPDLNQQSSIENPKPPFVVAVVVGEKKFIGTGYTKQAARHDAASKALASLTKMSTDEKEYCLANGSCDRETIKSPISSVYEYVQLKQINLENKVIKEEDPAHEREYITQCMLGDLAAEGVGRSKKKSISIKNSSFSFGFLKLLNAAFIFFSVIAENVAWYVISSLKTLMCLLDFYSRLK